MEIQCIHCGRILSVTDKDIGIICRYCGKYNGDFQDRKKDYFNEIDKALSIGPHIPNKKLVEFRDGMERHAYEWKDNHPNTGEKFGPINPETGEHEL